MKNYKYNKLYTKEEFQALNYVSKNDEAVFKCYEEFEDGKLKTINYKGYYIQSKTEMEDFAGYDHFLKEITKFEKEMSKESTWFEEKYSFYVLTTKGETINGHLVASLLFNLGLESEKRSEELTDDLGNKITLEYSEFPNDKELILKLYETTLPYVEQFKKVNEGLKDENSLKKFLETQEKYLKEEEKKFKIKTELGQLV